MFKKLKFPHTYVIVFYIIIFAAVLTWIMPGGAFQREKIYVNGIQRSVVVNNSFEYTQSEPQTWQVFSALFDGFVDKADIIIFILIIGGAFWIMNSSKAIDVGILSFLKKTHKLEKFFLFRRLGVNNIILVLVMLMFSLFGAIFGMSEETIAFVIIFVPMAISMGYDSIVGVCMCFVAAGLGFAGALLNPFTIGIAQGISGLPLFSGIEYRFVCWIVLNLIGFIFIIRYAKKIKRNPKASPVYEDDQYWRDKKSDDTETIKFHTPVSAWVAYFILLAAMIVFAIKYSTTTITIGNSTFTAPMMAVIAGLFALSGLFTLRKSVHFFILNILLFTIIFLIIGVMGYGWYVKEIATLFFVMGIFSGIAMNYSPNSITKLFLEGVKDILSAAVIVGLAGGIIYILNEGKVVDTILFKISSAMEGFDKFGSVSIMYGIQTFINLFMPSGSAKAALTMPMMSQFSDLIGISRQATVMAFQFGDGFTNMITPTSGVLLGVLSIAKIPYGKWVKWILPFMIILIILGLLLLIPTVYLQLNGF